MKYDKIIIMSQYFVTRLTVLLRLFSGAVVAVDEKVQLGVYIESGCPVSQEFLLGELTEVLSMQDIRAITDFKYVPYGQSTPNENGTYDCYDNTECRTDSIQLCSLYKLAGDINAIDTGVSSYDAFPFVSCMEAAAGISSSAKDCWESTMQSFIVSDDSLTWDVINNCSLTQYGEVMNEGSVATPDDLVSIPWIVVNDKQLANPDKTLLAAICAAYTGEPKPPSCPSFGY